MNHLISQLQITEALATTILDKDSEIEILKLEKDSLEQDLKKAPEYWELMEASFNDRIEDEKDKRERLGAAYNELKEAVLNMSERRDDGKIYTHPETLKICSARKQEMIADKAKIEKLEGKNRDLSGKVNIVNKMIEEEGWVFDIESLPECIEQLNDEIEMLNEMIGTAEILSTKYFEEKEYYRKRLRRLEDRIRRHLKADVYHGHGDERFALGLVWSGYQAAERKK